MSHKLFSPAIVEGQGRLVSGYPFVAIQGTSVILVPYFVPIDASPPPAAPANVGLFDQALIDALDPAAQASLDYFLTTPLDQLFDTAWKNALPQIASQIQESAQRMINQGDVSVEVKLPPKGVLAAFAAPLAGTAPVRELFPASLPADVAADVLQLQYTLPSQSTSVSVDKQLTNNALFTAGVQFAITFDLQATVVIVVPNNVRFPLFLTAETAATGMNVHASNPLGYIVEAGASIVSFFTGHSPINFQPSDQIQALDVADFFPQLADIADVFTSAADYGFVSLGVRVNEAPPPSAFLGVSTGGAAVEFDLTHPFDPAPVVSSAWPPGPRFSTAQLTLSASAVTAGGDVAVTGTGFPPGEATELEITWTDTTSGTVERSEVQYGAVLPPPPPPPPLMTVANAQDWTVQRPNPAEPGLFVTPAPALTPGSFYAFRVRDFDAFGLIATAWSDWKVIQTQPTQEVQLVLSYADTVVGTVQLALSGGFSTSVTIPADVPPGSYAVQAEMAGSQLAQAPLTVVAAGEQLPPTIAIYNPATGGAETGMVTIFGDPVLNLRGSGFNPGVVQLWIDSVGDTSLGSALVPAGPGGSFETSVPWPVIPLGPHQILGVQGPLSASASVWVGGQVQ
jgi:hypothetical protein